jgi:Zn-dependent peptidase ImmA (M78 family)
MSDRPEPSRPVPTRASKARIHRLGENVAERLNFNPGDAIAPLVGRLGGRIEYHTPSATDDDPPESMIVYRPRSFVIYIPNTTSHRRDRFTIAHELGHYFLHFALAQRARPGVPMVATRWVDDSEADQQRAEWEANWFAAGFLMPEAPFRIQWADLRGSLDDMASRFDVSTMAIGIRARNLNLLQ